jgi:DNA-binding FrmR family transcriptional regulator
MSTTIKRRATHRSKIILGQMRSLEQMIESEKYCIDILTQSLAIQKSLASLNKLVLENHLRTHVIADLSSSDERQQSVVIQELLSLYELNNIRGYR